MSIPIYFRLYASDGNTLLYTFPVVFRADYPQSTKEYIEHSNFRGKGSIIVNGGDKAWDLTLTGVLIADDYEALTVLIDAMESAVVLNTPYVLKINKTTNTYYSYNVKRTQPIKFETDNLRTDAIEYTITLRVNSW